MTKEDFELRNMLGEMDAEFTSKENIESTIDKLKNLAKEYTQTNNELVDKLWKIDLKLHSGQLKEAPEMLQQQRAFINQQVLDADYSKKINEIITVIRQLEIQAYGVSDVGGNSPYCL